MRYTKLLFLISIVLQQTTLPIFASRCVVSRWRSWSECIGSCFFSQRVRNRDVLRPPFPEKSLATGNSLVRDCPALYEIENCTPRECEDETPFVVKLEKNPSIKPIDILSALTKKNKNITLVQPKSLSLMQQQKISKTANTPQETKAKIADTNSILPSQVPNDNRLKCGYNKQCCRIYKTVCRNGSQPKSLIRWHRMEGEPFCRAYNYPYCGDEYEAYEEPITTENVCLDLCFSRPEKTIFPTLRII